MLVSFFPPSILAGLGRNEKGGNFRRSVSTCIENSSANCEAKGGKLKERESRVYLKTKKKRKTKRRRGKKREEGGSPPSFPSATGTQASGKLAPPQGRGRKEEKKSTRERVEGEGRQQQGYL